MTEKAALEAERYAAGFARRTAELDRVAVEIARKADVLETNLSGATRKLDGASNSLVGGLDEIDRRLTALADSYADGVARRRAEADAIAGRMQEQKQRLDELGRAALEPVREAQTLMEKQAARLEEATTRGVGQVERAKEIYDSSNQAFLRQAAAIEDALRRATALGVTLEQGVGSMDQLTAKLSDKSQLLSAKLSDQSGALASLAEKTLTKVETLSDSLAKRLAALSELGGGTASAMVDQTRRLHYEFGELETGLRAVLGRIEGHVESLSGKTGGVRQAVVEIDTGLLAHRRQTEEVAALLMDNLKEFNALIDRMNAGADSAGLRLASAGSDLAVRAESISKASEAAALGLEAMSKRLARGIESVMGAVDGAGERVDTLRSEIQELVEAAADVASGMSDQVQGLGGAIDDQTQRLAATVDRIASSLRASTEEMRQETAVLLDQTTALADQIAGAGENSERITQVADKAMRRLEDAAISLSLRMRELSDRSDAVGRNMSHLTEALTRQGQDFDGLSGKALDRAKAMLEDVSQIANRMADAKEALAARVPTPVAAKPNGAHPAGPVTPAAPLSIAPISGPAPGIAAAAASAAAPDPASRLAYLDSARKVVEHLQSLSLDINRMIDGENSDKLLKAYRGGDRGAFTKALLGLADRGIHDRIRKRFRDDAEFKRYVTSYIEDYEEMVGDSADMPGGDMLLGSFMTSDIGRLYLLLCTAIRRTPVGEKG
jgi:methyl-accepting chemotaxis protein